MDMVDVGIVVWIIAMLLLWSLLRINKDEHKD